MIHRHKHEMTLKFPSIKNDNMLSGELRPHQCRLAHYLGRAHRERVVHLQVCALVTHAQTHLSVIRKLYGTAIPVVYSNVNHVTHCSSALFSAYPLRTLQRDADVWLEKSASFSSPLPCVIIRGDISLSLTVEVVEGGFMDVQAPGDMLIGTLIYHSKKPNHRFCSA